MERLLDEHTASAQEEVVIKEERRAGGEPVAAAEGTAKAEPYSRFQVLATMAGLFLALFFTALDQNITGTALPRIIGEFHGFDRFTWVTTAFMLASTVVIPIYGKLSDLLGRKVIFLTSLGIFLCGSALCGMAQSMDQLIFFRAFQGLGAGGIMPIAMIAFGDLLPPSQRAKMQGWMMGLFTFATIVGPLIGGWITDHVSWRWAFYVNIPFGLLALVMLLMLMPRLRFAEGRPRIDFVGAALLILGVVPTLLSFSWAGTLYPWLSWQILGLLGGGLSVLALLVIYEMRLARIGGEPILDPALFKNRVFTISSLNMMVIFMGMMGGMAFLPLYAQGVLRISATNSGLLMMPMMMAMIISSVASGQIASRTGQYKWLAVTGMGLIVAGGALLLRLGLTSSFVDIIAPMVLLGLGVGASFSVYSVIVMSVLPAEKRGQGIANMDFFQEMGGPVILAILGPIMASQYMPAYHAALPVAIKRAVPGEILSLLDKPDTLLNPTALHTLSGQFAGFGQGVMDQVLTAVRIGLAQGVHMAYLIGFVILLAGFVMVFFLPNVKVENGAENEGH
ncbi:MAG TPA: MDR family MFS transporter [Ktedonosporobacter sp.]|nr:MDR family MFS transporter [Ktedonosporobacter sp.]